MHISAPFIKRPVGTMLLTIAVLLAGTIAYGFLPVAALPEVDFPTIQVSGGLPGASPATMASSVATPLERQFGRIAGVTQMTSTSMLGSTNITLQFDLDRNIDAAARDVQAAINASAGQLPAGLPSLPTYRKVNPSDSPILFLAMTSDTLPVSKIYDVADSIVAQEIAQVPGVGQVGVNGGAKPAVRVSVNPTVLANYGLGLDTVRTVLGQVNSNEPKGQVSSGTVRWVLSSNSQIFKAEDYRSLIVAYRNGAPVRLGRRRRSRLCREPLCDRIRKQQTLCDGSRQPTARRQYYRNRRPRAGTPATHTGFDASYDQPDHRTRSYADDPCLREVHSRNTAAYDRSGDFCDFCFLTQFLVHGHSRGRGSRFFDRHLWDALPVRVFGLTICR